MEMGSGFAKDFGRVNKAPFESVTGVYNEGLSSAVSRRTRSATKKSIERETRRMKRAAMRNAKRRYGV